MAQLIDILNSFTQPDGKPDLRKRNEELNKLVSGLFPDEIRMLQHHWQTITFNRDFIPELPIELRLRIAEFLDISDVVTCRQVSRRWFETWTQLPICNSLMKQYFRTAYQNSYQDLPNSQKTQVFLEESEQLHNVKTGRFHSMGVIGYDQNQPSNSLSIQWRQYCNGRVAFYDGDHIKVTTLRTDITKVYTPPDREARDISLSNSFLIIIPDGGAKLHVWALEGDGFYTMRLPSAAKTGSVTVNRDIVAVLLGKGIFIWTIGGSARLVPYSDPKKMFPGVELPSLIDERLLFHPDDPETIFLVRLTYSDTEFADYSANDDEDLDSSGGSETSEVLQWVVYKFSKGSLTRTLQISRSLGLKDHQKEDRDFGLDLRKLNDSGLYSLGFIAGEMWEEDLRYSCIHSDKWEVLRCITFDTYQEVLSYTSPFHLPECIPRRSDLLGEIEVETLHLWSDQLLVPVVNNYSHPVEYPVRETPSRKVLVAAIENCRRSSDVRAIIRYVGADNDVEEESQPRLGSELGVAYCLTIAPQRSPRLPLIEQQYIWRAIQGDSKFVVLFRNQEYIVWSYDKSTDFSEAD